MLQTTLHLSRSRRLWTFQLLGSPVTKKKEATSTVSIEIHDFRPLFHTDAKKMNG
jgi:hypothetical protein